jgi:hypothetical protein
MGRVSDDRGVPAEEPAGAASANGNGTRNAAPDGGGDGDLAAGMMRELTVLLGRWEQQALDLAERGVDPRPLLRELARSLRLVADQLDTTPGGGEG